MQNTRRENISLEKIKLNPHNPRIGAVYGMEFEGEELNQDQVKIAIEQIIQGEDTSSDEKISSVSRDSFRALKRSIQQLGGIQYPIIIQKLENKEGNYEYIVLEGNTRLTIYQTFYDEEGGKENEENKWCKIPCEIIDSTNKRSFHEYQLTAHIVPAKSWGPFERAKYLHHLKQNGELFDLSEETLVQICGGPSRKRVIEKEIDAYEHMQKWKQNPDKEALEYDASKFQYFYQYQVKKDKYTQMGINENEFIKHIGMDILKKAIHVVKLDQIWSNPDHDPEKECRKIYLKDGSKEAFYRLDELKRRKKIVEDSEILDLVQKLTKEIEKIDDDIDETKIFLDKNEDAIEKLQDLRKDLKYFIDNLTEIENNL